MYEKLSREVLIKTINEFKQKLANTKTELGILKRLSAIKVQTKKDNEDKIRKYNEEKAVLKKQAEGVHILYNALCRIGEAENLQEVRNISHNAINNFEKTKGE